MMKLYIGRSLGRMICLELPASAQEVDDVFAKPGDAGEKMPVLVREAQTSVPHLEERLKGLDFEKKETRDHLNFLAERIGYLTRTEQDVFSAVLRMEDAKSPEEIINLSYNLDQYELLPTGTNQDAVSRLLLKKDKGIEIPAEIAGFLDHERVSSAYFLRHKGEFSPSGLVVKKEPALLEKIYGNGKYVDPGYEKDSMILLRLYPKGSRSPNGEHVLSVPAPPERIALARERLGTENLAECGFYTSCVIPEDLTDYLPAGFSVEEINQAATFFVENVLDGTRETFLHLLAVLEAECPRTLEEVLEVAENLQNYRICPDGINSPEEYVHQILEDLYVDGFLEQFLDMKRLAEALMAENGAVETSFGIVTSEKWRFRSFAKEPVTTRLISPLEGNFFEENEWGNMEETPLVLDGRDLLQYANSIQERLEKEDWSQEGDRGLAEHMDHRLLKQRVTSIFPGIEEIGGCLYGTATVVSRGALTPQELEAVMEYWSGQASDGWGEGFEQREIRIDGGELYVSFWQSDDDYEILTEDQFLERFQENSGPQMGGM